MKLILAAVVAAILIMPARAADSAAAPKAAAPAKSSWSDFFKNLKSTLAQSAVSGERKKGKGAQGVAAVRGKPQTYADPNEPGLKGDSKSAKAKREMGYDMELEASVDLLGKGKLEEGLKGLEAFKVAHPKHRVEDVDKAIEGAKTMIADKSAAPAATAASADKP